MPSMVNGDVIKGNPSLRESEIECATYIYRIKGRVKEKRNEHHIAFDIDFDFYIFILILIVIFSLFTRIIHHIDSINFV